MRNVVTTSACGSTFTLLKLLQTDCWVSNMFFLEDFFRVKNLTDLLSKRSFSPSPSSGVVLDSSWISTNFSDSNFNPGGCQRGFMHFIGNFPRLNVLLCLMSLSLFSISNCVRAISIEAFKRAGGNSGSYFGAMKPSTKHSNTWRSVQQYETNSKIEQA